MEQIVQVRVTEIEKIISSLNSTISLLEQEFPELVNENMKNIPLSVKEISRITNISTSKLYKLIQYEKLPYVMYRGKKRLYLSDVVQFEKGKYIEKTPSLID